jgi:hypothetical protein
MDTSKEYRWMCLKAKELQENWTPSIGDYIISKCGYCYDDDKECTKEEPCIDCLKMDNTYVISGQYNYNASIGGTHWFFGGTACVKGDGCMCNDTSCYIMTESGHSTIQHDLFVSAKNKMLWLPRQDQIQDMFLNGLTNPYKVKEFIKWLDTKASYNTFTYSLEMLWLMFYMYKVYNKKWNAISNILNWETVEES